MIEFNLSPFEARVLGVLAEKQFLTPDVYPLSLNTIVNACNQLSNRDPVMSLGRRRRWLRPAAPQQLAALRPPNCADKA